MIAGRRIKSFPIALIAYAVGFYMIFTGHSGWYVFIPFLLVFLERLLVQLGLYIVSMGVQRMMRHAMEMQAAAQRPPDDGPPLMGGRIDPPQ